MKKIYFIALLAFSGLNFHLTAQPPNLFWAKNLGGTSGEGGNSIFVDASGNVYTTGTFNGTVDFDPNNGTYYLTAVSFDIFVSKLDAAGNFIWAKKLGIGNGFSISVDANGNVYTTGRFTSGDFDPGPGIFNLNTAGDTDIFVSKLNSSGNFVWAKRLGGTYADEGYSIAINSIGNVTTTGYFTYTADFDPGIGTYNLTATRHDIFISTLDASGNFLWAKHFRRVSFETSDVCIGRSVALDANGNVYTTGNFTHIYDFDPGPGVYNLDSEVGGYIFVSKLDPSGNFIWAKQMGGGSIYNAGNSIAVDANGNVYTSGTFENTGDFNPDPFETYNLSGSQGDIFVSKLDANGDFIWAKKMGGPFPDEGTSMALDANGNVYTTGTFWGTSDFDPGNGTYNLTAAGSTDMFVSKLDPSGNFVWAVKMGGASSNDNSVSIAVDNNENVFTTGFFIGTVDFDPNNGTYNLTSAGNLDIFVEKLCQLASPTISGTTTFCQGSSTTLTASLASFYMWSTGATTQSINVISSGSYSVTVESNGCTATSQATSVSVNPIQTASVSIVASSISICSGQNATFTATPTNGGAMPTYQWFVNNNPVGNGPTYSTTTLPNGAQVYCTMTSSATCASPLTATSNIITVTVNPILTASVIIVASSTSICSGQNVTFTASPTNGGATPSYQWFVNNNVVGNGSTYSTTTLPNGAQVYCAMTSNATCASPLTATSNIITVTVNPLLTPSLSITGPAVICSGQNVTITPTTTNGGTMPTYQWFVNNVLVGTGSTYSTTTLTNGAQVYCTMMSNALCASPIMATSPTKTITVLALPNVQITANHSTTFCQGNSVVLTADPSGSYSWSTGATTKNITVTTAGNYTVIVTAANGCSAVSTPTPVTVNPLPEPPTIFPTGPIIISCPGDLTSSFANAYLWNTGASTQSITVSTTGDYSVTISDINGCLAASNPTTVECTIGASEASLPEGFLVSPNPSNGSFTVGFFLPEAKMVSYRVLNVLGQVVWAAAPGLEAGECQRKIDLGLGIMPGIYFLETRLDGRAFLWKIEVR